jgi:glycosyltransferase involved in cell wall biosynthesis
MHFSKEANLRNSAIALLTPVLLKTKKIKALRRNVQINTNNLDELLENCDKIFVIANWFKNLLAENGFGSEKIKFIPSILKPSKNLDHTDNNLKRKILFAGRIEKQKGLHLLCMAMRSIKTIKIELDVFGNIVDENYFKQCEKKYAFNFKGSISREELLSKLHEYDFLILPSVFTEMYSMILQESIYSHLPVIASSAKGNTAAVKENKNGFIFNYDDDKDLARVIDKAYYLKQNGWKPEFETNNNAGKDLSDILSFYS